MEFKEILIYFLFSLALFSSSVAGLCGNGIIEVGETCDTGPYVGYYYNGTCCSSNCTFENATGTVYNEITCTGNGNCNDGNGATTDRCVTVSGFGVCNNTPTGTQSPCPAACTIDACYNISCVSGNCRYTALTGPMNPLYKATHCLNETKCWGGFQCSGGAKIASAPNVIVYNNNANAPPKLFNCDTNISWTEIVGPIWSGGSTVFPPTFTVSIDDGGLNPNQCRYTFYVGATTTTGLKSTETGSAYFWWGEPLKFPPFTLLDTNLCQVRVNVSNDCNATQKTSITYSFDMRTYASNTLCGETSGCTDGDFTTFDSCQANNWCGHFPTNLPSTCLHDSECPTHPCYTARCHDVFGQACTYTATGSTNITAGYLDNSTVCYNESACYFNPSCDPVYSNLIYQFPEAFTAVVSTPVTLYVGGPSVSARNFFLPAAPYNFSASSVFGHPGFIYTITQVGVCGATAVITGSGTGSATLALIGPVNNSLPLNCNFTVSGRCNCQGGAAATTSALLKTAVTGCGDGIVQAEEQCDLGAGVNGLSTSCCNSTCGFVASGTVCRPLNGPCDIPETCTGSNPLCPGDGFQPNTYQCNTSTTPCTVNVTCTGLSTSCPSNYVTLDAACNSDNNLCTYEICDASHNCVFQYNISYNDGFYCNGVEQCNATSGLIIPGTPIVCNDNNSCTFDSCNDAFDTCIYTPLPNSTGTCGFNNVGACVLGNLTCDGSGPFVNITCVGAVLPSPELCFPPGIDENCNGVVDENCIGVPCDSDINCTDIQVGECEVVVCDTLDTHICVIQNQTDGTPCGECLACIINQTCSGGQCVGTPVVCNDNNPCTRDFCTEPLGLCEYDGAAYVGVPCDNEDPCDYDDACNNQGQCIGGLQITCPPTNNQCTSNVCNSTTGNCTLVDLIGACTDNLACTTNTQCIDGTCQGSTKDCNDFISCTTDICVEPSGNCQNILSPGYCYIDGSCYSPGAANPANPCLVCNATLATTSWSFTQGTNVNCNDNQVCTTGDKCNYALQACVGVATNCSSFTDQCNVGICDPFFGNCVAIPLATNTSCTNNLFCVQNQVCSGGACVGGAARDCSAFDSLNTTGKCNETGRTCYAASIIPPNITCGGIDCGPLRMCELAVNCIDNICVAEFATNNTTCQTANLCTADYCNELGECVQGPVIVDCPALDSCHGPGVCVPSTGLCSYPSLPDGTVCNDHNHCTQNDTCVSSVCVGSNPIHCSPLDQCHSQGICNPLNGQCSNPPLPDYTPCETGNQCFFSSVCLSGNCTDVNPVDCSDPNPCITTFCDNVTGCHYVPNSDPCDDGDACTNNTYCFNGECAPGTGTRINCDDGDPSTIDTCSAIIGCIHSKLPTCLTCNVTSDCPNIPCQNATCLPNNTCAYTENDLNTLGCLDSSFCNGVEYCSRGGCQEGTPPLCDDSNTCTIDSCNYTLNACQNLPNLHIRPFCVSDNLCAVTSRCDINGQCTPQGYVVCSPAPPCQFLVGCNPGTGLCEYLPLPDGSNCDDHNACTSASTCQNATCVGTGHTVCSPINQCHIAGTCDVMTGLCPNISKADGTSCDDGLFCTPSSSCLGGTCQSMQGSTCPFSLDLNDPQCQVPVCDELGQTCSIVNLDNGTPCIFDAPRDVCSGSDECFNGFCTRFYADGDICRGPDSSGCNLGAVCLFGQDSCPANTLMPDNSTCDTGTYCNLGRCSSGSCLIAGARNCSILDTNCEYAVCNETLQTCQMIPRPNTTCFSIPLDSFACTGGCTYDRWPLLVKQPGFRWPSKHEYICKTRWESLLDQDFDDLNDWYILAKEFISAELNQIVAEACIPTAVTAAALQAIILLEECNIVNPPESQEHLFRNLSATLRLYNSGTYGPGLCNGTLPYPVGAHFNLYLLIPIGIVLFLLFLIAFYFDLFFTRRKNEKSQ